MLNRRPSRIALAASAVALSAILAACGGAPAETPSAAPTAAETAAATPSAEPTPTPSREPVPVSNSIDGIEVVGEPGSAPTLTIPTPFAIDETRTRTLVEGQADGPAAAADSVIEAHYVGFNGRTGEQFGSSWDQGTPAMLALPQMVEGFTIGMTGAKPGQRVLIAMPGSQGYDGVPTRPESVQDGDTLVFVVDVVAVSVKDAVGAAETPQLPVTLGEAEGKPTVTIDTASTPPAELVAVPVIKGAQRAVGADDYVLVKYRMYSWKTGELIDDKFAAPVAGQINQTLEGFKQGIVGQPIGSRVVLVVPPKVGYEKPSQNPPVEAGDTVVYVVDILFGSAVA
ncbi:FKBP-type peptidyl-prolyl cis-trans isomerase [Propioniciclava sp. MC1683]|uniref:FKBP-type peptidyl-prolyl cis-trans isomerase n=1 Tax=Propioniciclava sp. MC1683 TaxID=2760309 RepID=UPI001603A5C9|nr:FKBP-type peptidyl-prolyl cis-trans isomerase [Propioniciclava sp. MC1683]MBB1500426.1 FKBP-type peptidyl-prolyl cis-trans isomerase [Propioniciclava sp. MC1683]